MGQACLPDWLLGWPWVVDFVVEQWVQEEGEAVEVEGEAEEQSGVG
jgi:hypothetical protein